MTFSISARCAASGMFGLAISSSSPAVAARCAHARAGAGAVSTQNITDPTLGPLGLDLMERGASATEALAAVVRSTRFIAFRQLALIDRDGHTASYSGEGTLGRHATAAGQDCICAGNLLANEDVPSAMVSAFEGASGPLGDRLLLAMRAGMEAGGEEGPLHSAGLLLVRDVPWPVADLRVDWSDADPIAGLEALWRIYEPQLEAYVTRALDPTDAPSYGVPGNE
ncbi:MAG: DUF1028 domain-containing protein [Geminicoccaceae bacterium]|nr:DUF1028 domain-containing protein [Geminicoccaceae bacterium]